MSSKPVAAPIVRYRLLFLQAGWIILTALSVMLYSSSIPLRIKALQTVCVFESCGPALLDAVELRVLADLGLSTGFYARYIVSVETLGALGFIMMGLFIFWRRISDLRAFFFSTTLITYAVFIFPAPDALSEGPPFWKFASHVIQAAGLWSSLVWLNLFPTGTFRPRWTKPLTFAWAGLNLAWVFLAALPVNPTDPYRMPVRWFLMFNFWYISGLVAQVVRYRRISSPSERQQTKWVLFGLLVAISGFIALLYPLILPSWLSSHGVSKVAYLLVGYPLLTGFLLCIPVTEVISIVRWRLHDIDILIRRTLVYSALTGCLGLVYFGGVLLLQPLLPARSPLATVLSILAVAALFSPLRGWIQSGIDRRFYRQKFNAEQVLVRISVLLRENVEIEALITVLLSVVEEAGRPAHAAIWMMPDQRRETKPPQDAPRRTKDVRAGLVTAAEDHS